MKTNNISKSIVALLSILFIFNSFISIDASGEKEQWATNEDENSQPITADEQLIVDNFGPGPG